ncbi:MAG: hypothetical protein P4M08_08820 [Oligoflexia bacterium]|nr:hypothetical protein [Oligoflexia bacterium]
MIEPQSIPLILVACTLLLAMSAVITIVWGRLLSKAPEWLVAAGLVFPAGALIFAAHALAEDEWKAKVWLRGWVWPTDAEGALTVGILQDRLGLLMAFLAVLLGAVVLANRKLIQSSPRRERAAGAVGLGVAGVVLSWISATPWLGFIGLALAIAGGLIAQLCFWDDDERASSTARFAWERFGGLALAIFGACGIAGSRAALVWSTGEAGHANPAVGALAADILGAVFFVGGLVAQFGIFPLTGWSIRSSFSLSAAANPSLIWFRIVLAQVFPAWAAFAALMRLFPVLEGTELMTATALFMVIAAGLSLLSGLLQKEFKNALSVWTAAGFSLASAALFLAGPRAGFSLFLGMSLGIVSFSGIGATLSSADAGSDAPLAPWLRAAALLGIAVATSAPGFISAGGGLLWLEALIASQPAVAVAAAICLGLFSALGWKLFFSVRKGRFSQEASVMSVVLSILVLFPALGVLATGSISGGTLPRTPSPVDEVLPSLMSTLFEAGPHIAEEANFATASGLLWGAFVIGIAAAYWIYRLPKREPKNGFYDRLSAFVASGYRVDDGFAFVLAGVDWVGSHFTAWVDGTLWSRWIPLVLATPFRRAGVLASRADRLIADGTREAVSRVTETPARVLQWVQNGDVQWYLIFALGSGFAILVYFLRA